MTWKQLLSLSLACSFGLLCSCTSGGSSSDQTDTVSGNACSDLNIKILNGEQCKQSISPVVLVIALANDRSFGATCSGTLITPTTVLTAAHCLVFDTPVTMAVRAGPQTLAVSEVIPHPLYPYSGLSSGLVPVTNYDIGIIKLAKASSITPVSIVGSRSVGKNEQLAVFGYGLDQYDKGVEEYGVDALKATHVRVSDRQENLIITSYDDTKTGACEGDSGGPLTAQVDGSTAIVGVVQGGTNPDHPQAAGCGDGYFDVFTAVHESDVFNFITSHAPGVNVL